MRAFVLNNLVRSLLEHEVLHFVASGLCEIESFLSTNRGLESQRISLLCEYAVFCSDTKPTVAADILPFSVTLLKFLLVLHLET